MTTAQEGATERDLGRRRDRGLSPAGARWAHEARAAAESVDPSYTGARPSVRGQLLAARASSRIVPQPLLHVA